MPNTTSFFTGGIPRETLDCEVKARVTHEEKYRVHRLAFLRRLKVSDLVREALRKLNDSDRPA